MDIEAVLYPHRAARRLPLPERFAAAIDWAEMQIRTEMPSPEDIVDKLKKQLPLSAQETRMAVAALTKEKKRAGRPPTEVGRNLWLFQLVRMVAREFKLTPTRGNASNPFSAADAVAGAMARRGLQPQSHYRIRRLYAKTRPEMAAAVRAISRRMEAERRAKEKFAEELMQYVDALAGIGRS